MNIVALVEVKELLVGQVLISFVIHLFDFVSIQDLDLMLNQLLEVAIEKYL
jgi:hypothetical protein